jgi:hypothetical protein
MLLSIRQAVLVSQTRDLLKSFENMKDEIIVVLSRAKLGAAGRKRWKGVEKKERSRILSAAGKASWADLTSEQRSVEMKRRARVRKRNKAKARKTPAPSSR